jgi:hypothetical protein
MMLGQYSETADQALASYNCRMTFTLWIFVAALSSVQAQESKPIPNDSVEVEARGCLKGRVFTATVAPEDEGTRRGPDITGRNFRVSGKKDVMDLVKQHDGHRVAIVGIVRKAALADEGLGMKVGGTRVVIGAPSGDPARANQRAMAPSVPVMDLTALRFINDRCTP